MDWGTRAARSDEAASIRRRKLETALERGHDLAVASYIANGVNAQDLGVSVAEELFCLLPDGRLIAAAAAR